MLMYDESLSVEWKNNTRDQYYKDLKATASVNNGTN